MSSPKSIAALHGMRTICASFGKYVERRFHEMEQRFQQRFVPIEEKLDSRFNALDTKIDRNFRWHLSISLALWLSVMSTILLK